MKLIKKNSDMQQYSYLLISCHQSVIIDLLQILKAIENWSGLTTDPSDKDFKQ